MVVRLSTLTAEGKVTIRISSIKSRTANEVREETRLGREILDDYGIISNN